MDLQQPDLCEINDSAEKMSFGQNQPTVDAKRILHPHKMVLW